MNAIAVPSQPVRKWVYRTLNPEFLALVGANPEDLYTKRRAWLERLFLGTCRAWEIDDAEIEARIVARRKLEKNSQEQLAIASDFKAHDSKARAEALLQGCVSGWTPPENSKFVNACCLDFLRDELYSFADLLIDTTVPPPKAVSDFVKHIEDLGSDIMGRRWDDWRIRLRFPDEEVSYLRASVDRVSNTTISEFEEVIWGLTSRSHILPGPTADEVGLRAVQPLIDFSSKPGRKAAVLGYQQSWSTVEKPCTHEDITYAAFEKRDRKWLNKWMNMTLADRKPSMRSRNMEALLRTNRPPLRRH